MGRIRRDGLQIAVMLAAAAWAGACGGAVLSTAAFESETGIAAPVQPDPKADSVVAASAPERRTGTPAGLGGSAAAPAAEGPSIGFGDGRVVADQGLVALGGARSLVQMVLYDGYGVITARDPTSGNIDRVVVRTGAASDTVALPAATIQDPEHAGYPSEAVAWDLIAGLAERTPGDLGIDGGVTSHVIVEKNLPFTPDLVIRVYVTAPRGGGRIDYFADGRVMRAFKD